MSEVIAVTDDGRKVKMEKHQYMAIDSLSQTRRGGCASVVGYVPTTNWKEYPVQDIQILTNFSIKKLYERREEALKAIQFKDVHSKALKDEKLSELDTKALKNLFEERKHKLISSLQNTNDGYREDAYRQAHDRCYAYVDGVKVHLVTEKVDGIKQPVVCDGTPKNPVYSVESIMIPYLQLNVKTRKEGKRKVVNSGAPVRMSNLIENCLNKRSVQLKTLTLKENNFESFHADHKEFLPEHVASYGDLLHD